MNMDVFHQVVRRLASFCHEHDGTTATEYAVMLALIIVAAFGALHTYGQQFLNLLYVDICSQVASTGS